MTDLFRYRLLLFLLPAAVLAGCGQGTDEVDTGSEKYRSAVSDFYISLAASQTDEARFSFNKMNEVVEAYPQEPAARANLGVYAMRQGNFELAEEQLDNALQQTEDHAGILHLAGMVQNRMGDTERAIDYFRRASQSDSGNLMIHYSLVLELEREDDVLHAEEVLERLGRMHRIEPENQVVIYELARVAAKQQNVQLLEEQLSKLAAFSSGWSPAAGEQLARVREAAGGGNSGEVLLELSFLRNALEPVSSFQRDLRRVQLAPNEVGYLITRFLKLPQPESAAAEPDTGITFTNWQEPWDIPRRASLVKSVTLLEDLPPIAVSVAGSDLLIDRETVLDFPGDAAGEVLSPAVLTEIDYNHDFMNDLALAWTGGFRLYRQNDDRTFTDVTRDLGISGEVTEAAYKGVWNADLDQDGDLDLVLAGTGEPVILRNNADGTFSQIRPFPVSGSVTDFHWADLDRDGAPEAIFLSEGGELLIYRNLRGGRFEGVDSIPAETGILALAVADMNADGYFDLLTVQSDFSIDRFFYRPPDGTWQNERLVRGGPEGPDLQGAAVSLFAPDLDNSGALDLLVTTQSGSGLWLAGSTFGFESGLELPGGVLSVFDMDGDERLDLLGIDPAGDVFRLINSGRKEYHARSIRARASGTQGDGRINSFGIGGEMEVRSGLLYQKQLIRSPIVHFGLGRNEEAEMIRIIWPNGSVQAEFAELGIGSTILNEQILKGSCPWLFTNDGEEIRFITDALWRSPLGLRVNAQETAGVIQTTDRVKIPGDKLANNGGVYDVRITAELWETHFFDYTGLVAVDHPEGSEVHVDERFVFPAPDLSTKVMKTPRPVRRVVDQNGRDVSEVVSRNDGTYLKSFEKTAYQGLVKDHYIEIEIGSDAPDHAPLFLLASGWLRPTDSSINLALSQGSHQPPRGLKIEVPDGDGAWKVLHGDYGVPAGKLKTILLDLENAFPDPSDRRIRMHTTSEIYWDAIRWAEQLPDSVITQRNLKPVSRELRYRGFSRWFRADSLSPLLPDYSEISGTAPRWSDLTGYHTRFGDVGELLEEIDDRYVIMNAGDEMLLEYEAPGEPREGWTRSFIFVSDGWVKDGDYNTEASESVGPLPYHGQSDYDYRAGVSLFNDPVYHRYRNDWIYYHTRYITSESFRSSLIFD